MSKSTARRRVPRLPGISGASVDSTQEDTDVEALQARIRELEEKNRAQQKTLDQLNDVVAEFYTVFPQHTQRVPVVRPGESPLIATVRCLVSSLDHANQQLDRAAQKAREDVRSKDSFLANMSHEIRTPMNGIVGMLKLVENTELSTEQREYIETISHSTETLLRILNDILDYSRLHANKLTLEKRPFTPAGVLETVVQSFIGSASEKNLHLQYYLDSNVPETLIGDSVRLRQVISNLVGNAIKFTEKGKVGVYLTAIGNEGSNWKLQFEVMDTGIGIDREIQQELFEPFTQADVSTGRVFGGTGLGLAICRDIVELMDGRIWVESEPGSGSIFRFTVTLPVATQEEKADSNGSGKPEKGSGLPLAPEVPKRVLLVEDDFVNQKVARLTLERLGYHVETARCGVEAVEKADSAFYDIICMDVTMPDIDGLEATRRIRKLESQSAGARILAVTGHAFKEDRERCLNAGMDDFIAKPFDLFQLKEALERVSHLPEEDDMVSGLSN